MGSYISSLKTRIRFFLIEKMNLDFSILRSYYCRKSLKNISADFVGDHIRLDFKDHQLFLRTNTSDEDVYYQVFIEEEYQFLLKLIEQYNSSNSIGVLLDIGANIGLTTRFLSEKLNLKVIYALEPDPDNYKQLELNLGSLNVEAHLINKAIWSRVANLEFSKFRDGRSWSKSVVESDGTQSDLLKSTCFDQIINEFGIELIDILKIDIEGSERKLLEDSEQFSKALKITKFLAIEIHDEVVSRVDFTDFVQNLGFRIYAKGETLYGVNMNLIN
jgi:FkbM family methyltransferase